MKIFDTICYIILGGFALVNVVWGFGDTPSLLLVAILIIGSQTLRALYK